jgi:hypothetical protein
LPFFYLPFRSHVHKRSSNNQVFMRRKHFLAIKMLPEAATNGAVQAAALAVNGVVPLAVPAQAVDLAISGAALMAANAISGVVQITARAANGAVHN